MRTIVTAFLLLLSLAGSAQTLYVKTFGNSKHTPLIFLHGGPGYNAASFEATTAQPLADNGFFVIVYDRRGEGRSADTAARFTFDASFRDLDELYATYHLKKATLIGHSFGGVIADLYADRYPQKVQAVVMVSAPVALQESFRTIIRRVKVIYEEKKDSSSLKYLAMLQQMDTSLLQYSSYCFMHAMQNGFYAPKEPVAAAKAIYATFKTDTLIKKYASQMSFQAPTGFWQQEKYTCIDLTPTIKSLVAKKVKIYGLYGREDGLYSPQQVADLQAIIGNDNLEYFDHCSHNVFIDQQAAFIAALQRRIK